MTPIRTQRVGRLTWLIALAMAIGVVAGALIHALAPTPSAIAAQLSLVTTIFLRLIRMVVAPLVLATLSGGVAQIATRSGGFGRPAVVTLAVFVCAGVAALTIGVIAAEVFHPGSAFVGHMAALHPGSPLLGLERPMSPDRLIEQVVPVSIADAMARNEVLQIVVFSLVFGLAAAHGGPAGDLVRRGLSALAEVMLQATNAIMQLAPLAVLCSVMSTFAAQGLDALARYLVVIGGFYTALGVFWALLILVVSLFVGRRVMGLLTALRPSLLLALATASSEAAYPSALESLKRFGFPERIVGLVLPLGYTLNLDGSMLFCSFAGVLVAQAYGMHLALGKLLTMGGLFLLTSKGIANVPRAALVVITTTLPALGLPAEGVFLIIGIDHILDMGRTATNVLGNAVAVAIVSRTEPDSVAAAIG